MRLVVGKPGQSYRSIKATQYLNTHGAQISANDSIEVTDSCQHGEGEIAQT